LQRRISVELFRGGVVCATGAHRLDGQIMVVLDVDRVLELVPKTSLAAWTGSLWEEKFKMTTCLVVDDSGVIRKIARRILEQMGFQVVEAEDGEKALELCKRGMPDAILLDWNMPVMDGYEFLGHLRHMPGGDAPRVVFCTTENDVAHIASALAAGANEYIMKPFDKDIVAAKFQEVGLVAVPV
jgi:two-component system chemotaxis response regulator CheY